ncbi:MAG: glycosyltransferase, partial [Candidatus Omnitrophica bacterium]|nr:glycosyltransferase [Candidatus Omnitrophota bacterium]
GIKASNAPYVCVMNNDTIATAGWLRVMMDVMDSNPEIGLLNPSSNTSGQFPEEEESLDEYNLKIRPFARDTQELYTCRGFCMLMRRSVMEKVGLLDETYHLGYFDDTDYCKRAQAEGFRTARAKGAYVYHKENLSFKQLKDNEKLFKDNERIFFEKWGRHVKVGYFADNVVSAQRINELAIDVARSGHQIWIYIRKGLDWPVTLDHFDIRKSDVNPLFFAAISFYKILKRKKKKKLDILVTDNRAFGNFLKIMKPLHGSEVMIEPDKKSLSQTLRDKSRIF